MATQKPSSPRPPGKPTSQPSGKPKTNSSSRPPGKPTREPAPPSKEGGSAKPDRKAPRGGPYRSGAKSRPREPRPAAPQGPREGRLVAGHDEELLFGRHAVAEALRAGRRHIRRVFLAQDMDRTGILLEIVSAARLVGCPVVEVPRARMDDAVGGNHQGVIAQAAQFQYVDVEALLAAPGDQLFLALDHLQDVQNLGTLLRTAEAMGVAGVILPGRRSAAVTPAVVNASSGAVEHLRIALVGNLAQTLEALKAEGVWVAGLDAVPQATPVARADLTGPLCLVVGAEGAGLSRLVQERCDWLVSIPMVGKVESLNASVAGSIVLAAARQSRMEAAARLNASDEERAGRAMDALERFAQSRDARDEADKSQNDIA